ncbi:pyridoxamine 5'-phosphate oxidase family protein [Microbacterium hominis]|uniref:Pyridoxamine 5'-phosphate oxidase family protein n=1 Tax=Microbacterium hominis TaxID=162426 RepID=A0A7D4Q2C3_9MICO|nr:pyridoxamine 5'-phosphate oxidase family protein [Microbacterium hominis]QKJ20558.1 pyridoxamine 5'-phosphate oxidase family protein [Microbacterium hominis]
MTQPFAFDPGNAVHAKALARLESDAEQVVWIATIGRDGYPHTVPVWFLWRDGKAFILSQPETAKVRNLRADPHVALNLEAGADGEQLLVLRGVATLHDDASTALAEQIGPAYVAKYGEWMLRLGLTMESMAAGYSTVIEVTPHKLIAW